jgi:hypothetical protein
VSDREEATDPARISPKVPFAAESSPHCAAIGADQEEGIAKLSNNRDYNQLVKRVNAIRLPATALNCFLLLTSTVHPECAAAGANSSPFSIYCQDAIFLLAYLVAVILRAFALFIGAPGLPEGE